VVEAGEPTEANQKVDRRSGEHHPSARQLHLPVREQWLASYNYLSIDHNIV
jgi:hypothetical protein